MKASDILKELVKQSAELERFFWLDTSRPFDYSEEEFIHDWFGESARKAFGILVSDAQYLATYDEVAGGLGCSVGIFIEDEKQYVHLIKVDPE